MLFMRFSIFIVFHEKGFEKNCTTWCFESFFFFFFESAFTSFLLLRTCFVQTEDIGKFKRKKKAEFIYLVGNFH